jgi:hypothetical protein
VAIEPARAVASLPPSVPPQGACGLATNTVINTASDVVALIYPGLATCPKRSALLARLWADVDGRLTVFEEEMRSVEAEKAVKVLTAFAAILERLTALDQSLSQSHAEETDDDLCAGDDIEALRAELDTLVSGKPRSDSARRDPQPAQSSRTETAAGRLGGEGAARAAAA